jgi:subtilase family serine protease
MKISKIGLSLLFSAAVLVGLSQLAAAQVGGAVSIPHSGIFNPQDKSHARTYFRVFVPTAGTATFNASIRARPAMTGSPPAPETPYQTPASLACIYGLVGTPGTCNPNAVFTNSTGGSKVIALVDAYHYPYALSDLQAFSAQFGLPAPNLQVVYASGTAPATDPYGWEMEEALDLQWAHAMAPNAKLILVEAASNSDVDLLAAVDVASGLVNAAGGGQVSMSWGESEFSGEAAYDTHFQTAKVTYFASSGDSYGTSWPCVSPFVVCVGGTTLRESYTHTPGFTTFATGNFLQEVAWTAGGGGLSQYYSRPAYQNKISGIVGNQRGVPDVSSAADPYNGAWVVYTPSDGSDTISWYIIGGTSWSSPTMAGIANTVGGFSASSTVELTKIYTNLGMAADFRDIVDGWCGGTTNGYFFEVGAYANAAVKGWDECTGVGSSIGKAGK